MGKVFLTCFWGDSDERKWGAPEGQSPYGERASWKRDMGKIQQEAFFWKATLELRTASDDGGEWARLRYVG